MFWTQYKRVVIERLTASGGPVEADSLTLMRVLPLAGAVLVTAPGAGMIFKRLLAA